MTTNAVVNWLYSHGFFSSIKSTWYQILTKHVSIQFNSIQKNLILKVFNVFKLK